MVRGERCRQSAAVKQRIGQAVSPKGSHQAVLEGLQQVAVSAESTEE